MLTSNFTERQLEQKIQSFKDSISRIKEVSSKFNLTGKERINRVALFDVEIKHTNQFTINLGCNYYAGVRGEEAIRILEIKIKHYQELQKKSEKETKNETVDNINSSKTKLSPKPTEGGYIEKIGEENGETIFNIVQLEEENEWHDKKEESDVVQKISHQQRHQNKEITIRQTQQKDQNQNIIENPPQRVKTSEDDELDEDQDEQNLDHFDSEEEEYDDIILNHRAKYGILQEEEIFKKKEQIPISQQKVQHMKDHQIKNNTSKAQKNIKSNIQKEQIPQKISRFKLQRMKERLEQQL